MRESDQAVSFVSILAHFQRYKVAIRPISRHGKRLECRGKPTASRRALCPAVRQWLIANRESFALWLEAIESYSP